MIFLEQEISLSW